MFDEITKTDWMAIIALMISSGSLFLEIRRWFESGVNLKLTCIMHPYIDELLYIGVTVSNRGDTSTTLTKLTFVYHTTIWDELRYNLSKSFIRLVVPCSRIWKFLGSSRSKEIPFQDLNPVKTNPHFLEPGRGWGENYPINEYINMLDKGRLWLCVYANHTDKPAKIRLIPHKKLEEFYR